MEIWKQSIRIDHIGYTPTIPLLTLTRIAGRADAGVVVERFQLAVATVVARRGVARILHRYLAQARGVPDRAPARERRHSVPEGRLADATVLAPGTGSRVTRVREVAKISSIA